MVLGPSTKATLLAIKFYPHIGNAVYLTVNRRTYAPLSVLSALMVVAIALCLLLYRSMRPEGVHLSPVRTEEEVAEAEDAVVFMTSDEAVLLEHDLLSLDTTRQCNGDSQAQDSEETML